MILFEGCEDEKPVLERQQAKEREARKKRKATRGRCEESDESC
jgi:hypothetical protein